MKRVVRVLGMLAACTVIPATIWIALPVPTQTLARPMMTALTIEDRHGTPLRSTRSSDGSQELWVSYDHIDADLINAFVAVEDRRFWDHHGVDVRAIVRAMRDNIGSHAVTSGASTITMQLARILQQTPRRWDGKLVQAMWALRLDAHLSKQQVLEQYLNRVHLGQAAVGVGAASALYFGSSAQQLSVGQAATLAGLAHAPSRDNPRASPRLATARREYALRRMVQLGYATREDVARSHAEAVRSLTGQALFRAPHFTTHVLASVQGDSARAATVQTSLDLGLQEAAEAEVRHTVEMLHSRGVEHAAVVVLDNESGEVLAWVGSPDFWEEKDGQTDMVTSPRQPGSALKPFLYGLALDRGFTAATVLPDVPKVYATAAGTYAPRNYDRRFRGPVRVREALASSYNVPAVELASRVGAGTVLHTLHLAGFESLNRGAEHYGLGIALGNGDVTLIELANAYRALAMNGEWRPWTWRVAPSRPARLREGRRVISPVSSAILLDILSDGSARIPGFGLNTPFEFPFPVAVKTGTSRHFTDNWAVATTRGFTVAAWAGNFSGRPMQGVSGVAGAGPLLHRVVMETAKRVAPGAFVTPSEAGAIPVAVCRLSGLRATGTCAQLTEWFVPGSEPAQSDDWERRGAQSLPEVYAEWSARQAAAGANVPRVLSRSVTDSSARFMITSPRDGDRYAMPLEDESAYATIALRASGARAQHLKWFVDGKPIAGGRWSLAEGAHVFRAVSPGGDSVEARVTVMPR
ncbi:MAG: penicillin-binding protein 1C [Gemmatimonadota bacterium]